MTDVPLLEMRAIRKRFGPVVALDGVSLALRPGEIRGLLGGNGAGKTTLMNVLYGLYRGDSGDLLINGQPVEIRSPQDAIRQGIGMVHQHFLQVNGFSVAENIVLGTALKNRPTLRLDTETERIMSLAGRFGLPVDPAADIVALPMGIRQRVEILKALYRGVKILVLDEPTTNLTPQEVDGLFASLRAMVGEGLSVIFITHKLREVLEVCDTITVLRHGRDVLTQDRADASESTLVQAMVGQDLDIDQSLIFARDPARALAAPGDRPVLELREVAVEHDGILSLHPCTLSLHEGEIVGVAGVAGNGQRELAELILGLQRLSQGSLSLDEIEITDLDTAGRLGRGIAYVPEDRWSDGFLARANVAQNLILGQQRLPPYSDGRLLDWGAIMSRARDLIAEFTIKTQGPRDTAGNLSGGNIQRVMLARAFARPVRLLIAHNPTRGLDIPSMEFIYGRLLARCRQGMATLLISENLDELFLLCHRVVALCRGEIMGSLSRSEYDKYTLGRMMSGVKQGE